MRSVLLWLLGIPIPIIILIGLSATSENRPLRPGGIEHGSHDSAHRDHEAVKKLFAQYDAAGDEAYRTKQTLFDTIKSELLVHMDIEETIFYPTVKADASEELKDRDPRGGRGAPRCEAPDRGDLEDENRKTNSSTPKVTVLKENIEHHVREEEGEMFPNVKKRLGKERLEQLGEEMEDRKESLKGED